MAVVDLNVVRFEQEPGLCGAATAQMILFYKNRVGGQPADQEKLWTQIQAYTGGVRPPSPPNKIKAIDCPTWTTQQCDKCKGDKEYMCWCTYPPALRDTLTYYNLPMAMSTPATGQDGTASLLAGVDFDVPSAALVSFGQHWVVVTGYETDGANAQPIGGRQISEVYIRDPGAANHNVTIELWMNEYLSPVIQCGLYLNRLVVIAATAVAPPLIMPPRLPINIRIADAARLVTVPAPLPAKPPRKRPKKPPVRRLPSKKPRPPSTPRKKQARKKKAGKKR